MNSRHIACPHCGQRIKHVRAGARLSPLKARLFDAIRRGESYGVRSEELIERLGLETTTNCIRAHIWQINDAFERQRVPTRIISREFRWKIVPVGEK